MNFNGYQTEGFYDELFAADDQPHPTAASLIEQINALSKTDLKRRQKAAELLLYQLGNTFNVYGEGNTREKILPFDIIPRIIPSHEWQRLNRGLKQRVEALNLFIDDIYNQQKILKDKVIPAELIYSSPCYLKQCIGLRPRHGIWIHITGTDLIRDGNGDFHVLEDNLRCPSGISYVLENRTVQKRTFSKAFQTMKVQPISDYGNHLYNTLRYLAANDHADPTIIVLTPGIYNSAYFEHAYLAQQMGITLAQGSDLVVIDDHVMLRTTKGFKKVDVIYRRIDDDFLDPHVFRKDSLLGVPGIMACLHKGNVTLVNAPGTGIADDKAIYAYVPEIIKYYLDQDIIIPNVQTYLCENDKHRQYVLNNLDSLVIKEVNSSGGYGMLIGPLSNAVRREQFALNIQQVPRKYIAQPMLSLSRSPTIIRNTIEGRHVDFRPFALYGESLFVLPGGLTRVALPKDSLVVNSSQGGGSKDTWVLGEHIETRGLTQC